MEALFEHLVGAGEQRCQKSMPSSSAATGKSCPLLKLSSLLRALIYRQSFLTDARRLERHSVLQQVDEIQ